MNGSLGGIALPGCIFLKCALEIGSLVEVNPFGNADNKLSIPIRLNWLTLLHSIIFIFCGDKSTKYVESVHDRISVTHSTNFDAFDFINRVDLFKVFSEVWHCELFASTAAIFAHWANDLLVELTRVPDVDFTALAF